MRERIVNNKLKPRDEDMTKISKALQSIASETEQAAREIYYAMSFLPVGHPARANLNLALDSLGVFNPEQVGLSRQVLKPKDE